MAYLFVEPIVREEKIPKIPLPPIVIIKAPITRLKSR